MRFRHWWQRRARPEAKPPAGTPASLDLADSPQNPHAALSADRSDARGVADDSDGAVGAEASGDADEVIGIEEPGDRVESGPKQGENTYLGPERRPQPSAERELGDFTTTMTAVRLLPLAVAVGALGAGISLALLIMIGFFTHLFYYQTLNIHLTSPNANTLGAIALVIPVGGGLVVGLMARYGSEQIRGHGIPEAMENILINGSKVQPRLALLKPVSSAISIGTGGPFGAEGPIILTGGAVGSILGQLFRLTASQRRTLLVAGAAAGMSAVFGTPVAATLFGVELLVFELKPRSMVLIGLASATADALRIVMAHAHLVSPQPLFPVPHHANLTGLVLIGAAVIGIASGFSAWLLTQAVYKTEDTFLRLRGRLHWMWWPMIGGVIIGVGGLIEPRALGVGYNTIHAELLGKLGLDSLIVLFVVKLVIWSCGLGGGTSGGILAPILMMGAALGGVIGHGLPGGSPAIWALIGMAGGLGGVTRSPFTAVVFSFELTHDENSLLALLVAACLAHLISVLVLKRSILTEKVARRGFHVMREYAVDPLEAVFVREVMTSDICTLEPSRTLGEVYRSLEEGSPQRRQRLYPVLDPEGAMVGVLPWSSVLNAREHPDYQVKDVMSQPVAVAFPDETLSTVADRMAQYDLGVLPVVERRRLRRVEGLVSQFALLTARQRLLEEERHAERVLVVRRLKPRNGSAPTAGDGLAPMALPVAPPSSVPSQLSGAGPDNSDA
jgi:CIC family chloride channel protein